MAKRKLLVRDINLAIDAAQQHMAVNDTGLYGRGLSTEGYVGGYRDALSDVLLAMNDVYPNNSRFWPKAGKP